MAAEIRPVPARAPWKVTKMARFLDLATERRGSLASIPFNAVAGFNPDLALLAGPHPGTWVPQLIGFLVHVPG